jgi:hypothetical protein
VIRRTLNPGFTMRFEKFRLLISAETSLDWHTCCNSSADKMQIADRLCSQLDNGSGCHWSILRFPQDLIQGHLSHRSVQSVWKTFNREGREGSRRKSQHLEGCSPPEIISFMASLREPSCPSWFTPLLVSKSFDRIEVGSAKCWEHSTHNTHQRKNRGRDQ